MISKSKILNNILNDYSKMNNKSFLLSSIFLHSKVYELFSIYFEAKIIEPNHTNLLAIIELCKNSKFLHIKEKDIDHYISLTRFQKGRDKVFCDWCSICNGLIELILFKLLQFCDNKNFNFDKFNNFEIPNHLWNSTKYLKCIPFGVVKRNEKSIEVDKNQYKIYKNLLSEIKITKEQMDICLKKIIHLLEWKNCIMILEKRWCPFKYILNLDFNRKYYFYDSNNMEELKKAQNILIKKGQIDCNECVKVLNKEKEIVNKEKSIFEEYLKYIKSIYSN
ncbi:MAG: hypothetical protein GY830_08250 [Bacteroidetes bacterium]|nr:hypothetical protein [Bacteroidota bacterium]